VAVFQATGNWTEEQRELDWLLMLDDLSVLLDGTTDAGWLVDVGLMLPLYSSIYLLGTLIIKILEYLCENERRAEGSAGAGKGLGQCRRAPQSRCAASTRRPLYLNHSYTI